MIYEQEFSIHRNRHSFIAWNFKNGFKTVMERSGRTKQKIEKKSCFWVGNFMGSFPNIKYSLENTSQWFETYFWKWYVGKLGFCHDLSITCNICFCTLKQIQKLFEVALCKYWLDIMNAAWNLDFYCKNQWLDIFEVYWRLCTRWGKTTLMSYVILPTI